MRSRLSCIVTNIAASTNLGSANTTLSTASCCEQSAPRPTEVCPSNNESLSLDQSKCAPRAIEICPSSRRSPEQAPEQVPEQIPELALEHSEKGSRTHVQNTSRTDSGTCCQNCSADLERTEYVGGNTRNGRATTEVVGL